MTRARLRVAVSATLRAAPVTAVDAVVVAVIVVVVVDDDTRAAGGRACGWDARLPSAAKGPGGPIARRRLGGAAVAAAAAGSIGRLRWRSPARVHVATVGTTQRRRLISSGSTRCTVQPDAGVHAMTRDAIGTDSGAAPPKVSAVCCIFVLLPFCYCRCCCCQPLAMEQGWFSLSRARPRCEWAMCAGVLF
nr:hypothetical protein [Pandoravirus massiliensis]